MDIMKLTKKSFFKIAAFTAFLTIFINLVGKLLGFIREVYISSYYGISTITDIFFAIQQFPVFVYSFMFGAFNLVFIPYYVKAKKAGSANDFIYKIFLILTAFGGIITVLMILGSKELLPQLVGVYKLNNNLSNSYSIILSLSIIPTIVIGFCYGILHSNQNHITAMVLTTFTTLIMLIFLYLFKLYEILPFEYILPWSYVIGFIVTGLFSIFFLIQEIKTNKQQSVKVDKETFKNFFKQLSASSIENIGFNINQILTIYFSGMSGAGGIAAINYAQRISMLALSGLISPINQIIQSRLSNSSNQGLKNTFTRYIFIIVSISITISLFIYFFRDFIVAFIYERGSFDINDTQIVSNILVPYAFYLIIISLNQLFARYYFVLNKGGLYTIILLVGYLIANVIKPILVVDYGLVGVVWSSVIGEGISLLGFLLIFRRNK